MFEIVIVQTASLKIKQMNEDLYCDSADCKFENLTDE